MKITVVEARGKSYRLVTSYKFATCEKQDLEYALVRITTDDGLVGYGECPVAWHPYIETQESTLHAVRKIQAALIGQDPLEIGNIVEICNNNIRNAYAAKCGIDMALYDILGKKRAIQVGTVLSPGVNNPVALIALIPMASFKKSIEKTRMFVEQSYETYKVKVGLNLSEELRLVAAVREIIGKEKRLFIDANQGWKTPDRAIECIRKFEHYNIAWVEQPILKTDLEGLKYVKEHVGTPIMADESLFSPEDAEKLASKGAVDMFNIKLAKAGGLYTAEKIYAIAEKYDIKCMIGSYIESPLGTLAGYHFVRSHNIIATDICAWELIENPLPAGLKNEKGYMFLEGEYPGLGYTPEMEDILQQEFEQAI